MGELSLVSSAQGAQLRELSSESSAQGAQLREPSSESSAQRAQRDKGNYIELKAAQPPGAALASLCKGAGERI